VARCLTITRSLEVFWGVTGVFIVAYSVKFKGCIRYKI